MREQVYKQTGKPLNDLLINRNTPNNTGWYSRGEAKFAQYSDPLGLQIIGSGLEVLEIMLAKGQHVSRQGDVLRKVLPYCFHELDNGELLALGRDYKPLPMNCCDHADYEAFTALGIPRDRLHLDWAQFPAEGRTFLFNDGSAPWLGIREARAYMTRLRGVIGRLAPGAMQ